MSNHHAALALSMLASALVASCSDHRSDTIDERLSLPPLEKRDFHGGSLCDDPTMQSPDSNVCPLRVEERKALRDYIRINVDSIVEKWLFATGTLRRKPQLQLLQDALEDEALQWNEDMTRARLSLPDPSLLLLADELDAGEKHHDYDTEVFVRRVSSLVQRFGSLARTVGRDRVGLAWLRHKSGQVRLCLVRREGEWLDDRDRYAFVGFVDRSLTRVALSFGVSRSAKHEITLSLDDARWTNRHIALELLAWAANPAWTEDVPIVPQLSAR